MVKRVLGLILLAASCAWAQNPAPPVTGQITAATTNATCANNGVQNGGAVDQPINSFTGAVGISVTGTWTATLNIATTVDHGKTWTASGGTFTANQQSVISSVGNTDVCVFASAYTSGTAIVTFATSAVPPSGGAGTSATQTQGTAATGSAATGNPVLVAGKDGSGNVQPVAVASGTVPGAIVLGFSAAAVDAQSTTLNPLSVTGTGGAGLQVAPYVFNGSTWDRYVKCPTAVAITVAAAATQQIVAPNSGQLVRVCGLFLSVSTAGTLSITEGTGATCGTGTTTIGGQMTLPIGMSPLMSSGTSVLQTNVAGDGLCLVSGTAAVQGWAQVEHH